MRIWLSLMLSVCLLSGCTSMSRQASPSPNHQTDQQQVTTKGTNQTAQPITNNPVDRQAHLESLVSKIDGVKGAHCVILGNTAIVGIDVDSKLERARVGSIKYTVAEALRKDPHGANAIVTADIDINQRLNEIGKKIRQGNPVSGFATELADIIGRIVPQLPNDTIQKDNMQQMNQMNHQEQKVRQNAPNR